MLCFVPSFKGSSVTEEEVQTMALTAKQVNSMMVDMFTFVVTLKPDAANMPQILEKMQRHFRHVDIIYGCNQGNSRRSISDSGLCN